MKQIINNKMYDTETAKIIFHKESGHMNGSSYFYFETLYQKKNEEFFIYYKGNSWSKYCEAFTGRASPGEGIKPVLIEKVKKILGTLNVKSYIKLFGEPGE